MLFVVTAYFKAGMEPKEIDLRAAFTDHLASNHPRLRLGGPLKRDDGALVAIFYIAQSDSRAEIEAFINRSPYTRAGLYDRFEINALTLEAGSLG